MKDKLYSMTLFVLGVATLISMLEVHSIGVIGFIFSSFGSASCIFFGLGGLIRTSIIEAHEELNKKKAVSTQEPKKQD